MCVSLDPSDLKGGWSITLVEDILLVDVGQNIIHGKLWWCRYGVQEIVIDMPGASHFKSLGYYGTYIYFFLRGSIF